MDIYFDTMIISHLRNGTKYNDINGYIIKNENTNTFLYSKAHIYDLMNDKTDEKYLDLEFIGKYFGNNYLLKSFNQPPKIFQVRPLDAYEEELADGNNPLNNLDDLFDEPYLKIFNELLNFPINITNEINLDLVELPNNYKSYLKNLFSSVTIKELINVQNDFQNKMYEDKTLYKYLRSSNKNNQSIVLIDNYKNFNILEDKIFIKNDKKMTFIEYIDSCISISITSPEERYYHRFCMGYSIQNSMGLDSEKNNKANFKNTFHDGLHAFYASYCDLLITDDYGIIEKSQLMYKLL
jgi:hypothetical protein